MALPLSIQERYATPVFDLTAAALAARWERTVVDIACRAPPLLQCDYGLPDRIRGAWGRRLFDAHEARRSPAPPGGAASPVPSAREVFFTDHRLPDSQQAPKPYVFAVDSGSGSRVRVRLTLFGWTQAWAGEARDALIAALEGGIALAERGRQRRSLAVTDCRVRHLYGVAPPRQASDIRLRFDTPYVARREGRVLAHTRGFLDRLVDRVQAMALWQDARISERPQSADMSARFLDTRPVQHVRRSRSSGIDRVELTGMLGTVVLEGPHEALNALLPWLAMAETCHAGASAALGMGRFTLICYGR